MPLEEKSFDLVCCQFGAMFFPDRVAGYREVLRVLKPGGHFLFNVWDSLEHNQFASNVNDALADIFSDDPPRFMARAQHGYHDTALIRPELNYAGKLEAATDRAVAVLAKKHGSGKIASKIQAHVIMARA